MSSSLRKWDVPLIGCQELSEVCFLMYDFELFFDMIVLVLLGSKLLITSLTDTQFRKKVGTSSFTQSSSGGLLTILGPSCLSLTPASVNSNPKLLPSS